MKIACFIGLTIGADEARRHLEATYFGPVSAGDIPTVLAEHAPDAIGIIDGVFHSRPAVLHKDILLALSRGVSVFGAASMGALRAAELAPFGMVGVGEVYRRFASGEWTGDDEVAVPCAHHPAHGWRQAAYSEALVNVRATLARAVAVGVLAPAAAGAIVDRAKRLCYAERRWDAILDPTCLAEHAPGVAELRAALPSLRIDLKHQDAVELLAYLSGWSAASRAAAPLPPAPRGPFWDETLFSRPLSVAPLGSSEACSEEVPLVRDVLDLAIVTEPTSATLVQDAMLRTLLRELAVVRGAVADPIETASISERIEGDAGSHGALPPFVREEIAQLSSDEAICEKLHGEYGAALDRGLLLTLLVEGRFQDLRARILSARARRAPGASPMTTQAARALIEDRLRRAGIADAGDHFDRYLSWLPEHRVRSAAALVAALDSESEQRQR